MTWTAEDSERLQRIADEYLGRAKPKPAPEIVSMNADITVGSLLVQRFNAGVEHYIRRGVNVTWLAFYNEGNQVRYIGFDVRGPRPVMDEFYAWYRGFFRF